MPASALLEEALKVINEFESVIRVGVGPLTVI